LDLYTKAITTGKIELRNPVTVGEDELKELDFPISALKGRDIVSAQEDFEVLTGSATDGQIEMNKNYLAFLASRIAQIPYETILDMKARDFNTVTLITQRFLFRGD
jgi:hypothetical protein